MAVSYRLTSAAAGRIRRGIGETMENALLAVGPGGVAAGRLRLRVASVLAGLALVLAATVLIQRPAEAAVGGSATSAVAAAVAAVPSAAAQIDVAALIRSIVCPILNQLAVVFGENFFGGIVLPIIRQLQIAFGCITVSG
jgi:hypothetical protein